MSTIKTRPPAVAGMFYPLTKEALNKSIHDCFMSPIGPGPIYRQVFKKENRIECLIVPHAGYAYSGPVAAHSYKIANNFLNCDESGRVNVIIAGPNHYGLGIGVALSSAERWSTPVGEIPVRTELSKKVAGASNIIDFDDSAHAREHSIEVQLPFIQSLTATSVDVGIVPISLMMQDMETAIQIADAIHTVITEAEDERFLILGSSDLTHYEPQSVADKKDAKLLEQVVRGDLDRYYGVLEELSVTACGYGAIAVVMALSRKLSKTKATLLKYATSGDVTGDTSSVVGYSAVRFA